MNENCEQKNRRILLIDDNCAIHEDFLTILDKHEIPRPELKSAEMAIFGESETADDVPEKFEIDSAFQGEEGLEKIRLAARMNRPYAMAFVDVRMPPGWDGIETVHRIWEEYPQLQVVICTAYSDYDWNEIVAKLGRDDRLLILKKPFDNIEVYQLACALTEKWNDARMAAARREELERLVEERTRQLSVSLREALRSNEQLNLLAGQAMAASNAKNEFLANISHEFKTPMNAIMGFAQLLKSQDLSAGQEKYVNIIIQSCGELLNLVNNTIDYAAAASGHFKPALTQFRMNDILDYIEAVMRPVAEQKGLEFRIEEVYGIQVQIRTDIACLKQCLINLIDNAVKFTETGYVRVYVHPDPDDTSFLCFDIEDTGIGIPEERQKTLYEPFVSNGQDGGRGGLGLGLTTSRELAKFLNGKLSFTSTPGKGSVFTLCLPVVPEIPDFIFGDVAAKQD